MSFLDIPIYIINLKNEKKRLIETKKELQKIGNFKNINVFQAIDSEEAQKNAHKYIHYIAYENITHKLRSTKILPTWSSVGCAISHYKCWELIQKNYDEKKYLFDYGIIIEDDIKIENVKKALYKLYNIYNLFKKINTNGLLLLFNSKKNTLLNENNYEDSNNISHEYINNQSVYNIQDIEKITHEFVGTHFYFINIKYIEYLIKYILPIKFQIDIEIGRLYNNLSTNVYIFNIIDSGIIQNDKFSSLVQYHFLEKEEIYNIFDKNPYFLPYELCDIIYDYLPKRFIEPQFFYDNNLLNSLN